MCDYSLETYRSQPAQEGVSYETRRFPSHSIGFVDPRNVSTAICMACDMRLKLEGIPRQIQSAYGVTADEVVTFVNLETGTYHDGVRFAGGSEITLRQLGPGVKARVIDALKASPELRETADCV
ncbi:hypothetical protein [Anderseniella sp. Alg231-50]|uniref:hypothetical protein n=1 Tax=Anderseniella sp. Alg231-50 TaxID=1922226 RepID=UPI000D55279E